MISVVTGLGNPGTRYLGTRHNLGMHVLSEVASRLEAAGSRRGEDFAHTQVRLGSRPVELVWPAAYMNESGLAVAAALDSFQRLPSELLVICDDLSLPLGTIRFRSHGSHGGHNGLRSIIATLNTERFMRLRIGIGPLPPDQDTTEFVLSRFDLTELAAIEKTVARAGEAVIFALSHPIDRVMSRYNGNPAPPEE